MKPEGVQPKRDLIGKKEQRDSEGCPEGITACEPSKETMPNLMFIDEQYKKLESVRLFIHNQTLNEDESSKLVNFQETVELLLKEVTVISEWIGLCFPEYKDFSSETKESFLKNFLIPFLFLESAYLTSLAGRTDVIVLPSGNFATIQNPQYFLTDSVMPENRKVSDDDISKIFTSSFDIHKRNFILPMIKESIDKFELYGLASLLFWDEGIKNMTDNQISMAKQKREEILKELIFYITKIKKSDDASVRIATLMMFLPAVQRSKRRYQEDIEISRVFNVITGNDNFFKILKDVL